MLFRPFHPHDFEELCVIEDLCFDPPLRFSRRYIGQLVGAPNTATWIAEANGRVAGFTIVEWTPHREGSTAYLVTLEVAPAARSRGAGSELLRLAESSALKAEARFLWLHVDESNRTAIRLYQNHGYSYHASEKDYYAPGRDALIYGKSLPGRPRERS